MSDFNWSSIAETVGKAAPQVGALLGGPAGAAVGGMIAAVLGVENRPDAIATELKSNPEALLKIKQMESDERVKLAQLKADAEKAALEAETSVTTEVNKTIQAEAAAEHWPTYTWRPFIGFIFGINLLIAGLTTAAIYIAVMFGNGTAAAALSTLPAMIGALGAVNGAALPILGIASWFRGRMQADPSIPTINRG